VTALATLNDEMARLDAVEATAATTHAFVLEGWLPTGQLATLQTQLQKTLGDAAVIEEVSREEWVGENAPVVLRNPRLFRPFETLVGILPLPRYGSIDPTPFLAIFFPMFFGLVLGDVGYGLVLAGLALLLRHRAAAGSVWRSVAEIAGACAAFTVIFGLLYGELFGDAGARLFGLRAILLHREEALLPFLGLAIAIGVVHILLGLVLNLVAKLRQGAREAIGPGAMLLMVALIVLAILAGVGVLPRAFFTPTVLLVLALFPVLVVVEGILGPTELVSTIGHILSYARVMAVGTASVMMAVAANRMIGAMGSVVVGSLFALIFHLVNFALGIFSPTVHALRLHFVEFFGTFYSPGGTRYEPFRHWAPPSGSPPDPHASGHR
jgi:V/A-type H+/Na+-transporting ATPase subunit I